MPTVAGPQMKMFPAASTAAPVSPPDFQASRVTDLMDFKSPDSRATNAVARS